MATIIKYDANCLDGFLADCDTYIETYYGFTDPEEAASYLRDVMTCRSEVEKELKKLEEFIKYRQSLVDEAKLKKDSDTIRRLCNGKTVGLIRLRKAEASFKSVLKIYTDAEESEKTKASSAKLLEIIKKPSPVKGFSAPRAVEAPPAAGCGAPPASEVDDDETEFDDFVEENAAMHAHMNVIEKIEEIRQTTLKLVQMNYELMCLQYNVVPQEVN